MSDIDIINELCKKHPKIQKHIITVLLEKDKNFSTDKLADVMSDFSSYKMLLKNKKFNFFEYESIEKIYDKISEIVTDSKAVNFLKNAVSTKDKFKITPITLDLIKNAISVSVDLKIIDDEIFRKILKYKTADSLNKAIKGVISKNQSDIISLKDLIESKDTTILRFDKKKEIIVAQIHNYEASKSLGSKAWCISTSNNFWVDYVETKSVTDTSMSNITTGFLKSIKSNKVQDKNYQFFIWDKSKKTPNDLVGLTYSSNFVKLAGHSRNDKSSSQSIFNYIDRSVLTSENIILSGDVIIKLLTESKVKKYINLNQDAVAEILVDLDISYIETATKKGIIDINRSQFKKKIKNKLQTKEILKTEYLQYALENKIKGTVDLYLNILKPSDFRCHTIQYMLDNVDMISRINQLASEESNRIKNYVKATYLSSLSTVPIENPTIRSLLEDHMSKTDLSQASNVKGLIAKTISRGIKNNQDDWIKDHVMNQKISVKILTYSFIGKSLNRYTPLESNRLSNTLIKKIFIKTYDLILKDNLDYNKKGLTKIEIEKLEKSAQFCMEAVLVKKSINILRQPEDKRDNYDYKITSRLADFALKMLKNNYLEDWVNKLSVEKLLKIKTISEMIHPSDNNDYINVKIKNNEIKEWTNIILNGRDYKEEDWLKVKMDNKMTLKINERVREKMKNFNMIEDLFIETKSLKNKSTKIKAM